MRPRTLLRILVPVMLVAVSAAAQSPEEFAKMMKENSELLQDYSWKTRTEVTLDGETKSTQLYQVRYNYDGKLEKTEIGGDGATQKKVRGPLRKSKAKKKRKQAAELKAGLGELIDSYTHLRPERLQQLSASGNVYVGKGGDSDVTRVMLRDVHQSGDSVEVSIDSSLRRLRRYDIKSSLDGEPVHVVVRFEDLDDGPTYPAKTTVETTLKGKPLTMVTENFDYSRQGG